MVAYLSVRSGPEKGKQFPLDPSRPMHIGRGSNCEVRLTDPVSSRFHAVVFFEDGNWQLRDTSSRNGTKVNGEDTQLRILKYGDMISLGRSTILFGTRDQIKRRLGQLSGNGKPNGDESAADDELADIEKLNEQSNIQLKFLELDPPVLPSRLSPGQAAQLSEVLEFIHLNMRRLINSANVEPRATNVELDIKQWHQLIDLQSRISEYLRRIAMPED